MMIWLSHPLGVDDPRPPAIPAPTLTPLYTIDRDGAEVQTLSVASHTGTHLDAPRHVIRDGLTLHDLAPEDFVFHRPILLEIAAADDEVITPARLGLLPTKCREADLVLIRFGYGAVRRDDPQRYSRHCPGFGVEAGRWMRSHWPGARAIGMDVPSVACIAELDKTMPCHHELLGGPGRRFLIIEDMNLDADLRGLREVRVSPWLVRGMDSGPCSVVGLIDEF